jgi:hypothetical protein
MNDNLNTIVEGRVFEAKLFATNRDRGLYIGTLIRNRPQWLKENAGRWRYIKDIQREAASLAPSAGTEVNVVAAASGPNSQTSSHDIRKDSGEKSDVISVDISADDSSPSCQPESVSPDHVPSGSIQTELPPLETGRKQGRGRVGRQRKKRRLSAKALKARRKGMLVVLEYLPESPVLSDAARKAGVHRKKLEYWIKRSKAGDDGYDFECDGLMWRFHELVEFAIEEAHDKILEVAWKIAMGELYKKDGVEVPHLYVRRPNGKMMRFLLELLYPEKYGKHPKIDIPQKTGVVLIGGTPEKPAKKCPPASIKARKWKSISTMIRKTS